jgi:hypothetical protein
MDKDKQIDELKTIVQALTANIQKHENTAHSIGYDPEPYIYSYPIDEEKPYYSTN